MRFASLSRPRSPSTLVLLALVAGTVIGLGLSETTAPAGGAIVAAVEPLGTLFVNAIRMTVIPLVLSSLIVGIASSGTGAIVARLGGRGVAVFVTLLVISGVIGAIVAPPILSRVTLDPKAVEALRASAAAHAGTVASGAIQTPSEWLVALVPANAVSAAVDGAMLPLIVFALLFGLALIQVQPAIRARVVSILRGVTEAMLVIVRWLLVVAPIGVFALTLPLVARLGINALGALAAYVIVASAAAAALIILVLYPAAAWGGRMSLRQFARAALPSQAVAFSSRSSLAALPALIDSARTRLGMSDEITGFFLPFASVMFRVGASLALTVGALFIARLYGVGIDATQIVTIVATAIVTSFSIPGIPGGSVIAMVPVLASVALPLEGIGILLGVDTIPDMFRTTANVTGQLAAAAIVAAKERADR